MTEQLKPNNIELTCTEIGGLWGVYFQESMSVCFLKHFLHHLQDKEILPLAQEALNISSKRMETIRQIFNSENFPIPAAFSDADLNSAAPPLFHDPFTLSFIYMLARMGMINTSFVASSNVRLDVLDFFNECLHTNTELLGKAVKMMLSKGIYDRPPKMNYPKQIEYVRKQSFVYSLVGKKRPLNAIELSEIFFNIERNYFSVLVMLGFIQVVKDNKIKQYLIRGKRISESQITLFNNLLMQEDLLGTVPVSMEVTDSTISPFSDRLIMYVVHVLNSFDITLISHALSLAMRADLAAQYAKISSQVLLYAKDGFDIMVQRKWLEQPPLTTDRSALAHTSRV